MALDNASVTVSTTPTQLSGLDTDKSIGQTVFLSNTGAQVLTVGGPTVTATTGFNIASGANLGPLYLGPGEILYGIVSTSTTTVGVLRTGD